MPLPGELLKTIYLSVCIHQEQDPLRKEAEEMLGYTCLRGLTSAQLNGLIRLVLRADSNKQVSRFLKEQMQRRGAKTTGLNCRLPQIDQRLGEYLEQHFAQTLCQRAQEAAKEIYQEVCSALKEEPLQEAPQDFIEEVWRRLARESAGYIAGWYRIKST